jgi:cholestenol Delta-isomerase
LSRRTLAAVVKSLPAIGPASRVLAGPQAPDDVACFDFFRLHTATMTAISFPSDFWNRTILQLAHTEPAVWHTAIAIGALHRRWEITTTDAKPEIAAGFADLAEKSYGNALSLAKSISDPLSLLSLSLALAATSNLSGKWTDSRVHIASGQKLLDELQQNGTTSASELTSAADSLARMNLEAVSFSDSRARYPYSERIGEYPQPVPPPWCLDASQPPPIQTLSQAATQLFDILKRMLVLGGLVDDGHIAFVESEEQVLHKEIEAWEAEARTYVRKSKAKTSGYSEGSSTDEQATWLSIKLYHAVLRLLMRGKMAGPESRYDSCLAHFERIVSIAAAVLGLDVSVVPFFMSLEPGIVMPLYATATRCRHPAIRRHALALLRQANRQEGLWTSFGSAILAEKLIQAEEEDLGISGPIATHLQLSSMGTWAAPINEEEPRDWLYGDKGWKSHYTWEGFPKIPEAKRIINTENRVDIDAGKVEMILLFSGKDSEGQNLKKKVNSTFQKQFRNYTTTT